MNFAFWKRGQTWFAIAAAAFIGLGIGKAVEEREPVGKVTGKILFEDRKGSQEGVEVIMTSDYGSQIFRTRTRPDGTFGFSQIPQDTYNVSASTRAHGASSSALYVYENNTSSVTLTMKRSQSSFALKQHQKVFGTRESVRLPMSGYVDGKKPAGKDTVRVRVYQTRFSNVMKNAKAREDLERVGRSYDPLIQLPVSLRSEAINPKTVRDEQVRITEDDREGFFYKNHSFGKLANGLYLVDLEHGDDTACAWLLVTDTAIVTKKAGSQLLAYVVEMQSGKPIANANVQVFRAGETLTSAITNRNGIAEMKISKGSHLNSESDEGDRYGSDGPLTTVVRHGNDESVVNLNDYYNEGRGQFIVEAYTDRPIYRPGQKISFKGIARRKEKPEYASPLANAPGSDSIAYQYSIPTGQPIDVELRDPSGERVLKQRYTANRFGSFFGSVELLPEATTGVYSLIMQVNGETHTHDIVIASYQKPEFQVEVTTDKPRYVKGETVIANIKGTYYFGGALAGAKANYTIMRSPDWASYEEPEDEAGEGEYAGESGGEFVKNGDIVLDENGQAKIEFPSEEPKDEKDKSKPADVGYVQTEKYVVSVEVTDQSDRMVSGEASVKVVPGDFRLSVQTAGYVAEPNKPTDLTLTAMDYDGKPVANQTVTMELSYEEWKDGEYVTEKGAVITSTTDAAGRATVTLSPPKSGYLLFTVSAKDSHGRKITAMRSLWVVGDNGGDLQTEYSDLSVLTDKKGYAPGETARVLINASKPNLTVLLTIEGDRVAYQQVVAMKGRSTVVRVPMRAEYGPNIVLAACYVANKKMAQSEAALRVSLPEKEINVAIKADISGTARTNGLGRYQPGEAISYTVKTTDKNGKPLPCELSFGVVDEAIYALREDSPNALKNAFYPRRYNQVTTNYSFAIEYLGDADKAEPQIAARKKFPDTAYWNPTLTTDASGTATVKFNLPDNLTTWRATAVAQTLDTRLGRGVQKIMVNKDFFVRLEKPRFLTVKDESMISAIVHNNTETAQNAQVHLIADGVKIKENGTQSATIEPGKTAEIVWNVTATTSGTQKIRLTAWTPKTNGSQYTDGVETTIPIKPHGREMITGLAGQITDTPQTEVVRFDANAAPENSYVTIRITPSLIGALTNGVEYLVGYPYGCTEQTTSRILPDLVIQRLMQKNGFTLSHSQAELSKMVRSGLARLDQLQHESGEWGWWENDKTDLWMTAYALYGIGTARQEGYPISPNLLKTAVEGAKKSLATVQENLDRPSSQDSKRANYVTEQEKIRVFLLYSLAQLGETKLISPYRDKVRPAKMDSEGLAYLILLDKRLGATNSAAFNLLDKKMIAANGMMHWKSGVESDALGTGSDLTATAMGLRALLTVNRNDARIPSILRWMMFKRSGNYWATTRDTAWVLMALAEYLQDKSALSANGTLSLTLNGTALQTVALDGELGKEKEIVIRVPVSKLRPDKNEFRFSREGGTVPVFYTVEARQTIQQDEIPALSMAGIQVKREYLRLLSPRKGDSTYKERTEATENRLTTGDKIRVRLTLTVPSDMAYVLIEDRFPSGCETMERGDASEVTEEWKYWYDAINVRDDRIAFFVRNLPKGTHTLEYNLRAQTSGQCGALPTLLQAMYVPELKAESTSAHLTIERAK